MDKVIDAIEKDANSAQFFLNSMKRNIVKLKRLVRSKNKQIEFLRSVIRRDSSSSAAGKVKHKNLVASLYNKNKKKLLVMQMLILKSLKACLQSKMCVIIESVIKKIVVFETLR